MLKYCTGLNFFSGLIFTIVEVVFMAAKITFLHFLIGSSHM